IQWWPYWRFISSNVRESLANQVVPSTPTVVAHTPVVAHFALRRNPDAGLADKPGGVRHAECPGGYLHLLPGHLKAEPLFNGAPLKRAPVKELLGGKFRQPGRHFPLRLLPPKTQYVIQSFSICQLLRFGGCEINLRLCIECLFV